MPEYPAIAWLEQITGRAEVKARVAADGYVDHIEIISEEPRGYAFGHAALEGARRWRFQPGRPGTYNISMKFEPGPEAPQLNLSRVPLGLMRPVRKEDSTTGST
jgi:TonB family protein